LVNPLSNATVKDVWWVQGEVSREGEKYSGACQFGDESAGQGEFFAVVGIATDKAFTVGSQLRGVPENGVYTKFAVVRRSGAQAAAAPKRVVLVAGKPSHPPQMHEFNAGARLLA